MRRIGLKRVGRIGLTIATLAGAFTIASMPASAQGFQIHKNKLDKATFYKSPRQIQILDERPQIRDFREAPAQQEMISLPPGPTGALGGHGGGGAGALGDGPGGGSAPIQLGGPGSLPYRTPDQGSLPLPKSGFNGPSNIPAGGLGPRNALPSGHTTNRLMGKMMTPKKAPGEGAGPARGMRPTIARTNGNSAPAVKSYSGGYGNGDGNAFGGSSSRTESLVRGSLLKKGK